MKGRKLHDVLVIGGGPVGSRVATGLAAAGYGVVVLERKRRLGEPVCCTGVISRECVSAFAVDEAVIRQPAYGASLFSPSEHCLRLRRPEPQAYVIDRAAFDKTMALRAQSAGAEYILGSPVRDIAVKQDRVEVGVVRDGERAVVTGRVGVVATGFASRLVERVGLGWFGDFIMGAQAEVEVVGVEVEEIELYFGREIAPGFFAWLVPVMAGRARVGLLSRRRPAFYLERFIASLRARGRIVPTDIKPSYGGVPLKPLSRTYGDRLLAVGSAVGQVKPTTGGGVYYGLLCADIAAGVLRKALEGDDLAAGSLAGYQRRWRRRLGREMKMGYWARRFYERLSDRQVDRVFDIIRDNRLDQALVEADDLSFDWHAGALLRVLSGVMKSPFKLRGKV